MSVPVHTVSSARDAAQMLARDKGVRLFGGGTLLMRALHEGDQTITGLVVTRDASLKQIRPAGSRVQIGAAATMADIVAHRDLAFLQPAAKAVGGPAVRTMATVGGNLFAAHPYGDFAVALLALDATVSVQSGYSPREMPLDQFFASREREAGAIVTAVQLKRPNQDAAFAWHKVSRVKPKGISVLSIAVCLPMSGGRISGARVAYGAMAGTPVRVPSVERALEGRSLDAATIDAAKRVACDGLNPPTDAIASEWYRREVIGVHLARVLEQRARSA